MLRATPLFCCVVLMGATLVGMNNRATAAEPPERTNSGLADEVGERVFVYERDYEQKDVAKDFLPGGYMPDGEGITQNTAEADPGQPDAEFIRLHCQLSEKPWVGVYFLLDESWEPERTFNLFESLEAASGDLIKCRFYGRSEKGATVQFKVGGVTKGQIKDSLIFPVTTRYIRLTPDWRMYEIDLTGKDVSSMVGAFCWVCDRAHNGQKDISFDLGPIYFVKVRASGSAE